MAGLCKATIVGNLGADPEQRFTQDGRPITRFRVAVNNRRKDRDGNFVDHTEWFSVTSFGRQAEIAAERLQKGSRVYVDGRLESRTYQGNDGQSRYSLDIVANELILLDSRPRGGESEFGDADDFSAATPAGARPAPASARPPSRTEEAEDLEDLPF